MLQVSDIGWGAYDKYEGPFFAGTMKFSLPAIPDFLDKALLVVTATEGGSFDAVNMYDRCILSVGLVQFCERNFSFSDILGRCADQDPDAVSSALKRMPRGISFKKNLSGKWRFFDGGEVTTEAQQRALFLGGYQTGFKGSWTPDTKDYAKRVAVCMARIWESSLCRTVQAEATKNKLMGFVEKEAYDILFSNRSADVNFSYYGALRAMYISFAANNPTVANRSIQKAVQNPGWAVGDISERFNIAAEVLTFGPGWGIYPARYNAIVPALRKAFGVSIPFNATELKGWVGDAPPEVKVDVSDFDEAAAGRLFKLSNDVQMGTGSGIDAIDAVVKGSDEPS